MANKQPILSGNGTLYFPDGFAYETSIAGNLQLHSGGTNQNLDVYTSGTGVFRVNGNPLAPSAYTDTTNASNITSGVLPVAQVPNAVKAPSTFTNWGGGRAINTNYQNSNPTVRYVSVSLALAAGVPLRVYCDAGSSPSTQVVILLAAAGGYIMYALFIVLPNYFYRVAPDSGSVTINSWAEWN